MSEFPLVKCRKCGYTFSPDMKTKGAWRCPACQAKNPNLKRHYRSVADLCILGLVFTAAAIAIGSSKAGLTLGVVLATAHAVLLLTTIMLVYRSQSPWTDGTAKALIWTVFGFALLFNVVLPFALSGMLNTPAIVVYAFIFPYLFWLSSQADKCTASAESVPVREES